MADQKENKRFVLGEGRVINSSLFEKDTYTGPDGKEGKPSYKIEMAYPKVEGGPIDDLLARMQAFVDEHFPGASNEDPAGILDIDGGKVISSVLDGDVLAANKEKLGKKGDAYKGHWVIRSNTMYNKDGNDAPGGIEVWDEEVQPVTPLDQTKVYNGCHGHVAVTIGSYELTNNVTKEKLNALKLYLNAFQKTKDGERLASQASTSSLFKPVGRTPGAGAATTGGRRAAKG